MELTYISDGGERITLRQRKPFFLQNIDGTGAVKHIISTFKAPNQDGGVFVSGSLDMRNITIEGRILADSIEKAYELRKLLLNVLLLSLRFTLALTIRPPLTDELIA